jgi:hypothetical protein
VLLPEQHLNLEGYYAANTAYCGNDNICFGACIRAGVD